MATTHSIRLKSASSQYLSASDSASLSLTGDCTFEFWIKPITASSDPLVFDKSNGTAAQSMGYVQLDMTNKLVKFVNTDGSGYGDASVTIPTMVAGVWYHIAVVFTASTHTIEVFFNGKSMGTAAGTLKTSMPDSSAPLQIGRYQAGASNYLDAHLKYLRIFNDKRTSAEVLADAWTDAVSDANLVAEWKLDNSLSDTSGNSNTLTNNGSALFSVDSPFSKPAGVQSSAYTSRLIAASSQFFSATDHSDLKPSGDFTVEAWVQVKSVSSTPLIFQSFSADATPKGIELRLDTDSVPVILVDNQSCKGATALKKGEWAHVAGALSGTTLKIYVNGRLENTATVTVQTYAATNYVRIGARKISASGESLFWDGLIRSVRLFNDERTAAEIMSDALSANVTDANLKAEWTLDNSTSDTSGGSHTLTGSGTPTYQRWTNFIHGGLASYWTLDSNSNDSVGSNNGTDTSVSYAAGKKNNAAGFNGSTSKISSASSGLPTSGSFSISLWYKGASPGGDGIFGWGSATSSGQRRSILIVTNKAYFGGYSIDLDSGITVTDGNWHHLVFTWDSASTLGTWYVDGKYATSGTLSLNTTDSTVRFGCRADDTSFAACNVDETGAYFRDLNYGDVLDLYNSGNAIGYTGVQEFTQAVTATVSVAASAIKEIAKTVTASATATGSVLKQMSVALTANVTNTAYTLKQLAVSLIASLTATGDLVATKVYLVALDAATTIAGVITKIPGKLLSAGSTVTASVDKLVTAVRTLTASTTITGSVLKGMSKTVTATTTATASITKIPGKILSAASTVTASVVSGLAKVLEADVTITGVMDVGRAVIMNAAVTATATVDKTVGKLLAVTLSIVAKVIAPFWKTKYPAHGDDEDYEIKYPHD